MNHSTVQQIRAHSNGIPLIGKTKDFTPPTPERVTDSVTEGRIIESYRDKGFKMDDFTFTQEGMSAEQAQALGVVTGAYYPLTLIKAVQEPDGSLTTYVHEITGHVTKAAPASNKMGDEVTWKVDGKASTYKLTINGSVVHDINLQTQKVVMFGQDLTSKFIDAVS